MKDVFFYSKQLFFGILLLLIHTILLFSNTTETLFTQIFLFFAFAMILVLGIYGAAHKRGWSPYTFLFLFASFAINGIYLLTYALHTLYAFYILTSIIALFNIAKETDYYYKIQAKSFFKVKSIRKNA